MNDYANKDRRAWIRLDCPAGFDTPAGRGFGFDIAAIAIAVVAGVIAGIELISLARIK